MATRQTDVSTSVFQIGDSSTDVVPLLTKFLLLILLLLLLLLFQIAENKILKP